MEYRLNKYISSSGLCSRREADRYIEQGNVTINGKRATVGTRVLPGQKVMVNGLLIENEIEPVYIALNKPVGVVCTTETSDRDNIVDFVGHEQRVFPIGRLDKDSQGLILLTSDGDIVNKILRAGNNHKKEYVVTVNKPITDDFLEGMSQGVPILDRVTRKCTLKKLGNNVFQITLIQGLNRQIRRMCEYFGYQVIKLERIQIMNIKLGNLKQGNWRDLTESELSTLFDMIEGSDNVEKPKKAGSKKKKPMQMQSAGTLPPKPKGRRRYPNAPFNDSTEGNQTEGEKAKQHSPFKARTSDSAKKDHRRPAQRNKSTGAASRGTTKKRR